jgi:phosphoglycerol transferase MdoB-like AlkP superfamily enzyme
MQGVYSFPQGIFLNSYPNTKMRSISEILSEAGYYTEVLIGSEPNFDNSLVWFQKWFDFYEYNAENENDVALAKRFVELYRERPADKPLFFHWMSRSMHTTFDLPPDMGPKPEDLDEAYLKATAYMDSSLGIILDEVENGTRARNTLFVLTGDHSLLNGKQSLLTEKLGQIFDGFTWVSLIFNGPGIEPAVIENPVSQADLAPSLLGYLDISASNHFMGVDLLGKGMPAVGAFPPVFSFRFGDMAMRRDSLTYLLPQCTVSDSVMVFKSYLKPTWDTSSLVAGYEAGMPFAMDAAKKSEIGRTMQAAAIAWRYVVYSNLLMP